MNLWFFINCLTMLWVIIVFGYKTPQVPIIYYSHLTAIIGLFFVLINWNMHALFSKIRHLTNRKQRIKIANYARKLMPIHHITGIIGLIFIITHFLLVFLSYGTFAIQFKFLSGLFAFMALLIVSISGWMRRVKATRTRRLFHLYAGMVLYFLILVHIFM